MQKFIEMTGDTRDAAIEAALRQLKMDRDDVSVEVLDNGKKGFLGFGATPARVRVTYEVADEPAPQPEPVDKPVENVDNFVEKPKKLSITTEDTTPRLVKAAPKDFVPEKLEIERSPRRERSEKFDHKPRRERRPKEPKPVTPSVHKERDLVPVSEACMRRAETIAVDFINGLLEKMGIDGRAEILPQLECDQLRIDITGSDMGPVIGRRGDTLDAIQYLGSLVLNNTLEEHVRLSVDTEDYRAKRMESLERLARKIAMKVIKSHHSMTLEPMNPYERRIIHAALQDFNGVTTYSTGTEPGRRVVIAPVNNYRSRRD